MYILITQVSVVWPLRLPADLCDRTSSHFGACPQGGIEPGLINLTKNLYLLFRDNEYGKVTKHERLGVIL